ncbi:pentatricopeptide repeat-containing protein At5g18475 [Ipomoea triloba]|uniref:pentatricopeptide repeat-containing protein At5g18475 n=1 Tax=Ipomoea triloba TaxID=35885 RepID=UPI00125D3DA9|nr:pentatricopeptide repeat-containing protein At5g18475 [Ipomoea triloba]XP_031124959.1 pentatricopeptide repeat-containing protein At5g18475 [Ipomoea triloba]XP_031124960.1 pentatricopeptide repeat-containing protein At5g18475 [Ipomoea triloba]XP_031124961.1 pentatricopeptide repeat-containing protein At5g18475 [Ipomoea triloba]
MQVFTTKNRCFSSLSALSSSSFQCISHFQHTEVTSRKPDASTETSVTINEVPKKWKFISHEVAIRLIKREKDPQHALEIFNMVSAQKGFNHNSSTYAIILHKLAACRRFQMVDAVLHQMTYETCKFHEGIFINLMKHFSKFSLHEKVLEMFDAIEPIVREKPSLKAISTCLNLLVEVNQIDMAKAFLLHVQKNLHLEPNTCIFNILVKHHCMNADLEAAFEVVKEMRKSQVSYPNLITYSTLMDGLCRCGRLQEAIDLFEEMVSKDQILPDALTYNILIKWFSHGGEVDKGRKIMDFMRKNGCQPNAINYTTLMDGYRKQGRLKEAEEVFGEMKDAFKLDTVGYTAYISCLCKGGRIDEAIKLLDKMKENSCIADDVAIKVILTALCRECRLDEALSLLGKLSNDGVYLNKECYRIVLNILCKEGELDKAMELLGRMLSKGFWPHHATSNELLTRFCEAGKAADAAIALFGLVNVGFKPEPHTWGLLIDSSCRERKLLPAFQLLDELAISTETPTSLSSLH